MAEMIQFSQAILSSTVTFLSTPPIWYLFCLVCSVPIVKIVKSLLKVHL